MATSYIDQFWHNFVQMVGIIIALKDLCFMVLWLISRLLLLFSPGSYRETRKKVIGKHCRPRSDATPCGICSGSTLFANRIFHQKYNKSDKIDPTPLKWQMDLSNIQHWMSLPVYSGLSKTLFIILSSSLIYGLNVMLLYIISVTYGDTSLTKMKILQQYCCNIAAIRFCCQNSLCNGLQQQLLAMFAAINCCQKWNQQTLGMLSWDFLFQMNQLPLFQIWRELIQVRRNVVQPTCFNHPQYCISPASTNKWVILSTVLAWLFINDIFSQCFVLDEFMLYLTSMP